MAAERKYINNGRIQSFEFYRSTSDLPRNWDKTSSSSSSSVPKTIAQCCAAVIILLFIVPTQYN